MKIDFRQMFVAALSALLLFSSAGAWAICEREIEQVVADSYKRERYPVAISRSELRKNYESVVQDLARRTGALRENSLRLNLNDLKDRINRYEKTQSGEDKFHLSDTLMSICALGGTAPNIENRSNTSSANINSSSAQQSQSNSSQPQQLQAAAQQVQTQSRNVQQRADAEAQRRGRRVHDPAAEAHDCIRLTSGVEPTNGCNFKVNVTACVTEPRATNNMLNNNEYFQCQGYPRGAGLWTPDAGGAIYGIYPRSAGMVYWFACKDPAMPAEVTFDGSQLSGRCRNLGGN